MSANILPHSAPFSSVRSSMRKPLSSSERIDATPSLNGFPPRARPVFAAV
jgi:hypothetical protein